MIAEVRAAVGPPTIGRAGRAMGSPLRLQVASSSAQPPGGSLGDSLVDRAWSEVVDEFEATEDALSRFRETSEVHRLRLAGGRADRPSRRLVAALAAADRARRVTEARFDPRILADLERLGSMPIPVAPASAATQGWPSTPLLRRNGRGGSIAVPVAVDFGGIGKGLALRWAANRLERLLGATAFLLDAGGDLVSAGRPEPDSGWRVGIEDPLPDDRDGEAPLAVIELPAARAAVATSSTRRARWRDPVGREVHHLIDPRTGEPGGAGLCAVTVLGPDPAWAEVWSKALFLAGRAGIAELARSRGLAAWWVGEDGAIEMTPAARRATLWLAAEA